MHIPPHRSVGSHENFIARIPLPAIHSHTYKRHRPEQMLLYQLIQGHYPELLEQFSRPGKSQRFHLEKEFDEYLECGRIEHEFSRVVYDDCKHEKLVTHICKNSMIDAGYI